MTRGKGGPSKIFIWLGQAADSVLQMSLHWPVSYLQQGLAIWERFLQMSLAQPCADRFERLGCQQPAARHQGSCLLLV